MADNSEAFNNLKKEIRSILIPHQKGCSLYQFRKEYKQMLGRDVPYYNFNYQDDLHLLKSIPDTVRIWQMGADYQLMAVADESTKHIQKMVAKQKPEKNKPTKNKYQLRYTNYSSRPANKLASLSSYHSGKQASYPSYATPVVSRPSSSASQSVRTKTSYASQSAQFDNNPINRQSNTPVPIARQSASNTPVPIERQFTSNTPVPIARRSLSNTSSFYPSNSTGVKSQTASLARIPAASNTAASGWVGQRQCDVPPRFRAPVSTNILPPDVECRIVSLVRKFATGLRMSDFPMAYHNYFKGMFSFERYGFDSLKQCLASIPDLALRQLTNDFVICYVDKSSAKPSSIRQTAGEQHSGKLDSFDFSAAASPAPVKYKADEVFQFSASWLNSTVSSKHQTQKQDVQNFNQESDKQMFSFSTESYNLKSNPPLDEKSQYYQYSDVFKQLSSKEGTLKKKADVLDTFELSSTSSLGVTDKIKNNMREIMSKNKQGIFATEFPAVYEEVTGFRFDLHSLGFTDLTELVEALPDIFQRKRVEGSRKDWVIVSPANEVGESRSPQNSALLIECCIQNIRQILQGFPEGIQVSEFLNVYSTNLKEPLYILDFGFSFIDDFLLSISKRVPLEIKTVDGIKTVFLTETEEVVPPFEQIPTAGISSFPVYKEQELDIPPDAASPDCQYQLLRLPDDFDHDKFVPAYTSAISHPGHLYVQLEGEETTEALNQLYDEIEEFYYGSYSYQYQMKRYHVKERAMCAALWPQRDNSYGDDKWYRALIIGHTQDFVKVFYVDYGTMDQVPLSMLRYLKKDFTKLPAQALKARLAHLKPPKNAASFSPETKKRMLELCMDVQLMAKVEDDEDGVLSLLLCNTNGETDLFINDILLQEGLAVSIIDPATPPLQQQLQFPPHQMMQVEGCWPISNSLPEEVANNMQQLSLNYWENPLGKNIPSNPTIHPPSYGTPSSSPPADESEIFQDDDDLFEEFIQKSTSVSKRFVKRVRTSDGYLFHVLIVDEKAFVSSGDVSFLIWNDKNPQYLLERLQTREIIFPSRCISDKGNEAMFYQFEKFYVKGTQNNGDFSSIIIYPLESLIPLLNMYGHPSVELRHKIVMEIKNFNPQLPAWQEVSEVEIQESEEDIVFRAVTDDDKLNRLCIHDLMAMKGGIQQKRNQLVRFLESDKHKESTVDELDKLEGLLQRVVVRIEQIKQICLNYS